MPSTYDPIAIYGIEIVIVLIWLDSWDPEVVGEIWRRSSSSHAEVTSRVQYIRAALCKIQQNTSFEFKWSYYRMIYNEVLEDENYMAQFKEQISTSLFTTASHQQMPSSCL